MGRFSQNKNKHKSLFGNFYSPYITNGSYEIAEYFEAYKNDPERLIEINNKLYSRIIIRCEFYNKRSNTLLVTFEPMEKIKANDILIDEYGREFMFLNPVMIRISGDFPEWYQKTVTAEIQGKDYAIGEYLTIKGA